MEGAETLSINDCLGLLAGRMSGRVAYTERALPAIWPVHHLLVGGHLVLDTHHVGVAARLDGQVVAFEIDGSDAAGEGAWIVVVTGIARILPAADGQVGRGEVTAVQITPGDVRGCRFLRTGVPAAAGSARRQRDPPLQSGSVTGG